MKEHLSKISNIIEQAIKDIDHGLIDMLSYQLFDANTTVLSESNIIDNHNEIACSLSIISLFNDEKNYSKVITGLSALYLFKTGLTIHDDIGSGTPNSNGKDTLWWKWGPAQAINAGDCLYSLSKITIIQNELLETNDTLTILRNFDNLILNIFRGKYLELQNSEQYKIDFNTVKNIYDLKEIEMYKFVSTLFNDNIQISNLLNIVGEINLYNKHLNAFNNLLTNNANQNFTKLENEILNKKKILPIAYIFDEYKNSLDYVKKLGTIYMKRMLELDDVKFLNETFYSSEIHKNYDNYLTKQKNELKNILNSLNDPNKKIEKVLEELSIL